MTEAVLKAVAILSKVVEKASELCLVFPWSPPCERAGELRYADQMLSKGMPPAHAVGAVRVEDLVSGIQEAPPAITEA